MEDNIAPLVWLADMAVTGALAAALARRKNRSGLAWGIGGALFAVWALIVLAFTSYLCPRCHQPLANDEARHGICPRCDRWTAQIIPTAGSCSDAGQAATAPKGYPSSPLPPK